MEGQQCAWAAEAMHVGAVHRQICVPWPGTHTAQLGEVQSTAPNLALPVPPLLKPGTHSGDQASLLCLALDTCNLLEGDPRNSFLSLP